jgi:hypothetical protein
VELYLRRRFDQSESDNSRTVSKWQRVYDPDGCSIEMGFEWYSLGFNDTAECEYTCKGTLSRAG